MLQDTLFTTKLTDIRNVYLSKKITDKLNINVGDEFDIKIDPLVRQIVLEPKRK